MNAMLKCALACAALLMAAPAYAADAAPAASSSPTASAPAASSPDADKIGPPAAGKGRVIFFRKGRYPGALVVFTVREDGAKIGKLSNGSYFFADVEPGVHVFSSRTEGTNTVRLEIDPGETYYVECLLSSGLLLYQADLTPADQTRFSAVSNKLHLKTMGPGDKDEASAGGGSKDAAKAP